MATDSQRNADRYRLALVAVERIIDSAQTYIHENREEFAWDEMVRAKKLIAETLEEPTDG